MHPRDPFDRAGWAAWGIVALLLLILPAACHVSLAAPAGQVTFSPQGCKNLLELQEKAFDARRAGIAAAPYARYLALRLDRMNAPAALRPILQRELLRVWTSGQPLEALTLDLYTRCMTGPMGGEDI